MISYYTSVAPNTGNTFLIISSTKRQQTLSMFPYVRKKQNKEQNPTNELGDGKGGELAHYQKTLLPYGGEIGCVGGGGWGVRENRGEEDSGSG